MVYMGHKVKGALPAGLMVQGEINTPEPPGEGMIFYDCISAPSPRRVRIFIAEKGIEVPTEQVDLRAGVHLEPSFRARSPRCTVPVLELDDGTCLWETLAICDYLESRYPEPPLLGRDPRERALVLQWNARIEQDGFQGVAEVLRNTARGMRGRALTGPESFDQIPDLADRGRRRAEFFFGEMDAWLGQHRYVVGHDFTLADITLLVVVDFADRMGIGPGEDRRDLRRWHREVGTRPSARV